MKRAVLFGGPQSLDFQEVRQGLCRIPEVSLKIEEAQKIWDQECSGSLSFQHFLSSDNSIFFNNINVKSLIHALIQVGLYERHKRKQGEPNYLIGNTQNDPALLVCAGVISLKEMIMSSRACAMLRPLVPVQLVGDVLLKGQNLPTYEIYEKTVSETGLVEFRSTELSSSGIEGVLRLAHDGYGVKDIIHVGPGSVHSGYRYTSSVSEDLRWMDSIDIDPMLSWFWSDVRKHEDLAI